MFEVKIFFVLMKYVPSQVFEKSFLTLHDLFGVPEIFSLQYDFLDFNHPIHVDTGNAQSFRW